METALMNAYRTKADRSQLVRYADDLVVFHPTEEGVKKAQEVLAAWLADMGLELKPSKTRIVPRRWVIERTNAWIAYHRRLSRDFEGEHTSSEAFIYVAMSSRTRVLQPRNCVPTFSLFTRKHQK